MAAQNFDGVSPGNFGKATSVEPVQKINDVISDSDNINRSKDSAFIPPAFGSFSADMPGSGELLTPNISGAEPIYGGTGLAVNQITSNSPSVVGSESTGGYSNITGGNAVSTYFPEQTDNFTTSSYGSGIHFTSTSGMFYSDGTLGKLRIPAIDLEVKIYEDESLESLKKGAGHFSFTSCWEGNVCVAGHNRGIANHFGKIHTLEDGDRIIYETKLGTKKYEVFSVEKINETDYSKLQPTDENMITLITCVENQPSKRWCVQAKEI